LEAAVQKGLIRPLDDSPVDLQNSKWYPYARELSKVNGMPYGIPFAGDAQVIVYRPNLVWIKNWDDILLSEGHLIFAGADPNAETGLALYVSAGGTLTDAQGRPILDQEILAKVLEIFSKGRAASLWPDAATNIATEAQVLQEYRARRADMAIFHFSDYRASQDGLVQPLMGLDKTHFTFAAGWTWSLVGQNPANQQLAGDLLQFLTADEFLSEWIQQTGYLPTSRSSTTQAADSPVPAIIDAMQPAPSADILTALGPAMQDALVRVINGEQPAAVARNVVEKLK
jgi:ABC-type glycerol-3-phosphate transport system substrate-binding protein